MTTPNIWINVGTIVGCLLVYLLIGIAFTFLIFKLHIFGFIGDNAVSLLWDFDSIDEAAIVALLWPIYVIGLTALLAFVVFLLPFIGLHKILSIVLRRLIHEA